MNEWESSGISSLLVSILALLFGAFFTSLESALQTLSGLKLRQIMDEEELNGPHLDLWLNFPSRIMGLTIALSTAGLTLACSYISIHWLSLLNAWTYSLAMLIMIGIFILGGKIIPKAIGRAYARPLALSGLHLLRWIYKVVYPLAYILGSFNNSLLRRLGSSAAAQATLTEDDLEYLIQWGEKAGVIAPSKKDMLAGVINFDETKVREVMTPRTDVVALERNETLKDALKSIVETGHSRLPVYQNQMDRIVGIVFAKDLLRLYEQNDPHLLEKSVSQIMRDPVFMPDSKPIVEVLKELKKTKNHMSVIIDEYGGMAGIITMEDILEEIVGDIQDEFDSEEASILKLDPGIYDVSGSMNLSEFCDYFKLDDSFEKLVEGEVDTLGGWMTQLLGDMPAVGQKVHHGPLLIEVSEIGRHRIERLRVTKLNPSSPSETLAQPSSGTETK